MSTRNLSFLSFRGSLCFFFNDTATTEIYTLSLHDALPICGEGPVDVVLYPVPVHFKGSGFYSTDYGRGSRRRDGSEAGEGEGTKKDEKKTDKKDEKKAAAAD